MKSVCVRVDFFTISGSKRTRGRRFLRTRLPLAPEQEERERAGQQSNAGAGRYEKL